MSFDPPIGDEAQRAGAKVWPGHWKDANIFGNKYELGYHTGADLNLNKPKHDSDKGKPVYAAADGQVTFARDVGGNWQSVVVIKHNPLPDGKPIFTRYGHMDNFIAEGSFEYIGALVVILVGAWILLSVAFRRKPEEPEE